MMDTFGPVIKRCPLLGGGLIKIVIFGLSILSTIQDMSAIGSFNYSFLWFPVILGMQQCSKMG